MMKRAWLVASALWLAIALPVSAQTVTVGVGGQLSAPLYEDFYLPIYADMSAAGGAKLGSYTIRVNWDPAVLYYRGFERGNFAEPVVQTDSAFSYGVLRFAGVSAAGGQGVLELIRLRMYFTTDASTAVTLQVTEMSEAGTFADLNSLVSIQNGSACTARGRWGDLDNDFRANSRDALAILSGVVQLPTPGFDISLGDVDGDGLTNSRDALILLSYAVGIDITGQRVMLIAPGSCVAPEVPTLEIVPGTTELVIGQAAQLQVMSRDAAGTLTAVPAVGWDVDDPEIAFIDAQGLAEGRQSGTTTVRAALGPGVMVTGTVTVAARRPVWHVDALRARDLPVQLGTQQYPFSTPERAFPILSERDTILIAPGIHDYEELYEDLLVGAVILGDTLPDGTRPTLRSPRGQTFFDWRGGVRAEVKHLVLQGGDGIYVYGALRDLIVENVRMEDSPLYYSDGIYVDAALDTIRIVNSEFLGDGVYQTSYAVALWESAKVMTVHDSKFIRWSPGIYVFDVDSADFRRNEFRYLDIAAASWTRSEEGRSFATGIAVENLVDSAGTGIWLAADSTVITDNILTRIAEEGITHEQVYTRGVTGGLVARNRVTCSPVSTTTYGAQVYGPSVFEDNVIRDCDYGVYVSYSTSNRLADLVIRRDSILHGAIGRWEPLWISGRFGLTTIYGNTIRGGRYGMYLNPNVLVGDTARVVIDSNAVSQTTTYGIYISPSDPVSVVGVRNNISNNLQDGILNGGTGLRSFTLGRFVGNARWAINNSQPLDATQNWWGSVNGAGGVYGSGLADADSVSWSSNDVSSWLTTDPGDVPPLAPPARGSIAVPAPSVAGEPEENRLATVRERVRRSIEQEVQRGKRRR
jgi:nitrous oxidase accessory protein NosD